MGEVVVEVVEGPARVVEGTVDHLIILLKVVSRLPEVVIIMRGIILEEALDHHMVGVGVGVIQVAFHMDPEAEVVQVHCLYPHPLVFTYLHPAPRVQGAQALHMMIGLLEEEIVIVEDSLV